MPAVVNWIISSYVPSVRIVVPLAKEEQMYSAAQRGSLASLMLWSKLSWETLSNAPEMSRLRMHDANVGSFALTSRIRCVSISSAVGS